MKHQVLKMIPGYLALLVFLFISGLDAQTRQQGIGQIRGIVVEAQTQQPMAYAEIVITQQVDGAQVTGTISDNDGFFVIEKLPAGAYKAEIFFIGYKSIFVENIVVDGNTPSHNLGKITLTSSSLSAETVEVEGERAAISYQIDKKVVNVEDRLTAVSGNAVDVLKNVPSITVDIDGNVSLRGSGNFRVLIDGRPSVLDANDALQQIPASSIANIEIITNPSAKYDPEGTAGMLNIVLKKERRGQNSGLIGFNAGLDDKYGSEVFYTIRQNKLAATLGANYNRRFNARDQLEVNRTTIDAVTTEINSDGTSSRGRIHGNFQGSLSYDFTPQRLINFDWRIGKGEFGGDATLNYIETTQPANQSNQYQSYSDRSRIGEFFSGTLAYQHFFGPRQRRGKSHLLSADIQLSRYNGDEETINELRTLSGDQNSGQRSTEVGPSRRFNARLDYTLPFGKGKAVEAGYQLTDHSSEDRTALYLYDTGSGDYLFQPDFANFTDYSRSIHAGYLIYSGKNGGLGYQAGLRAEYTERTTAFGEENPEIFPVDRNDFFPSAHFSYELKNGQQLMASYSRRIERPRGWFLEPFLTYVDAFNVRSGNPALTPEYIDSYELGTQAFFGKNLASAELYYRIGDDRIERVRSVFDDNITLTAPANVGTDYALGAELMLNMDVNKKWNVNLLGNLYDYRIEGVLNDFAFSRESFNWNLRFNNTVNVTETLQFQLNSRYNSATVSSQGREEGFFATDVALKQSFLQRKLTATVQVNDLFGTEKYERISEGANFYNLDRSDIDSPVVLLNLRYNFNNFKIKRDRGDGGDGEF